MLHEERAEYSCLPKFSADMATDRDALQHLKQIHFVSEMLGNLIHKTWILVN